MSNICAGIGLGQIKILDDNAKKRRKNHLFYRDLFYDIDSVELLEAVNEDFHSNYWLNTILMKSPNQNKDKECLRLTLEANNIESRPIWKPMHLQPVFQNFPYYGKNIAEGLFEKGLCLPSGGLTDENKDKIKRVIRSFFDCKK